ncbi:MAG: hypothetical protein O3C40_03540 [Planctomycetota bacterium]|nr:hypothetical protein [Planctomycetota bacterium]
MNLLDENILASQRELLRSWRISIRQMGFDFQQKGLQDDQIISLLHEHRRTTFFTRDLGFYDRNLCHRRYCLVCLSVSKDEVAVFARRLLRHEEFRTQAKRLGAVIQVSQIGIRYWKLNAEHEKHVGWSE